MQKKLLVVDGVAALTFASGTLIDKNKGIVKKNLLVSRFKLINYLAKEFNSSAVIVILELPSLDLLIKSLEGSLPNISDQVDAFKSFIKASGMTLIEIKNSGTNDLISKIIDFAKSLDFYIRVAGQDIFLTRFIDKKVDVKLIGSHISINESNFHAFIDINPAQILDFIKLIGADWYKYLMHTGKTRPSKVHIKGIRLTTALNLLKKYSNISGIMANIESIPQKISSNLIDQEGALLKNIDLNFPKDLYLNYEPMPTNIPVEDLVLSTRGDTNYSELSEIYEKFSLYTLSEEIQSEELSLIENISLKTATARVRLEKLSEKAEYFKVPNIHKNNFVVYRIKNDANGRMYFGSTNDVQKRLKKHIDDLRISLHHNPELNSDFKIHGRSKFSIRILGSFASLDEARRREQLFIDIFYGRIICYNYNPFSDESAEWNNKKLIYSVCAIDVLSKRFKNRRGSVLTSGQGSWLTVHAAAKDLKLSKKYVQECFQKSLELGGEFKDEEWRFIVRDLYKKHSDS